jgi:hypothetical protein
MIQAEGFAIFMRPAFFGVKSGLLDTLGATYLVAAYYQVYNQGKQLVT